MPVTQDPATPDVPARFSLADDDPDLIAYQTARDQYWSTGDERARQDAKDALAQISRRGKFLAEDQTGGRMSPNAAAMMLVRVADRRHSPVGHATIRTITIPAVCPSCGGPRGVPYNHNFADDGEWLACDRWDNPCGHIDTYDAALAEAGV